MKNMISTLKIGIFLLFTFITSMSSCSGDSPSGDNPPDDKEVVNNAKIINLDVNSTFQTIEHFGASDAWSCQFVGKWPAVKKEAIADLLFSQELDASNNPKGIGLSLWRFNIGAGSAEQGSSSGINDEWRRAESFLQSNGSYNWDKQQGQVWFAQAAKSRGVDKLLTFVNSPPIYLTKNGKAHSNNGETNISSDQFVNYAKYLTSVIQGLQNKGLTVDYISPVNEPQWNWTGGQEGAPYLNSEIAGVARALNQELELKNLPTHIDIAEAGKINYLYENADRASRANQIQDFLTSTSSNYIGNLSRYGNAISAHSYFTTSPFTTATSMRTQLSQIVSSIPNLKFWMSEYCILGDNGGEINGNGRDLTISPALYVARTIHNDLVKAQASAWHWWLAVSPYDYKDGLVYIDYQKTDGEFYESKMLWALGNYSRFIRPGFKRVSMSSTQLGSHNENFLFSGYINPLTEELVVVIVNSGSSKVDIELKSLNYTFGNNKKAYITSAVKNLELYNTGEGNVINVPGSSILTLVYKKP